MKEHTLGVLSYNTERPKMHIPEYGRNVQMMINYAKRIESREERNRAVRAIIEVMGQLNPHLRDVEDYNHKLWTHLFVMSNFEIDVDSPYPIPEQESLGKRPNIMPYPDVEGQYGHYGYYSERMIEEVSKLEEGEEKDYLTNLLGNILKQDYLTFHTHNVENKVIAEQISEMSKGKLVLKNPENLKPTKTILNELGINVLKPTKKKTKVKKRKK